MIVGEHAEAAGLREVVAGVFAWLQPDGTWWVNNAGAVAGDDGVLIVDTCATERRTRRFLRAVAEATGDAPCADGGEHSPARDHTYGNSLLPEQTVIFWHEAMRDALLADRLTDGCPPIWAPVPDWGDVTRRVPSVVFRSGLTLHSGTRRVEVRHPGYAAHTAGDVVAWLPEERVLFVGDLLFNGLTPLVLMGSLEGALKSLNWLAGFEAEHIVPGHGPLADWADAERLVLNLHRAYADAAGGEVDLIAAFGDAMTWNSGPLPTSV
ncbi:cyclase [Planotetraspora sp. GP83]